MQNKDKLTAIGATDRVLTASARTWEAPKVVAMEDIDTTEANTGNGTDNTVFS